MAIEEEPQAEHDAPLRITGGDATGSTSRGAPDSGSDPGEDAAGSTSRGAPGGGSDVSINSDVEEVTAQPKHLKEPAPKEVWGARRRRVHEILRGVSPR